MNKLFVVAAAICAVALADTFQPADFPCKFHIVYGYTEDGTVLVGDTYGMQDANNWYVYEAWYLQDKTLFQETVISSQIKDDDGKYIRIEQNLTDDGLKCREIFYDERWALPAFDYTNSEDCECPVVPGYPSSGSCRNLTNDDGDWIVVDDQNRFRIDLDGYLYIWVDDAATTVTMDKFVNNFCNDDVKLTAPDDVCPAPSSSHGSGSSQGSGSQSQGSGSQSQGSGSQSQGSGSQSQGSGSQSQGSGSQSQGSGSQGSQASEASGAASVVASLALVLACLALLL